MFFTGKGDKGTSKLFNSNQQLPKHASVFEALGTVDELNSFLGLVTSSAKKASIHIRANEQDISTVVHEIQHDLFTVQAELAGADKHIPQERVKEIEILVNKIEESLPEITTFLVSGGTELSAQLDLARTVARRAERRMVEAREEGGVKMHDETMMYMNRLSSLLYALVRTVNHQSGVDEEPPTYA